MALALFGNGVIDVRGSVSGTTYSRSKFGATMRAKTSPVIPTSSFASAARTLLPNVSADWANLLTATERAAWNAFALLNPSTNVFGQVSYLTGAQWYTKTQINVTIGGGSRYTTPPVAGSMTGLLTLTVTAVHGSPGTLDIAYTHAIGTGPYYAHVFASPNLSPGISYVNSVLRDIGFFPLADSGLGNACITEWRTRFNNLSLLTGKQIFVLVSVMDNSTGIQSPGIFASTLVT
jgi:hypothetical protein